MAPGYICEPLCVYVYYVFINTTKAHLKAAVFYQSRAFCLSHKLVMIFPRWSGWRFHHNKPWRTLRSAKQLERPNNSNDPHQWEYTTVICNWPHFRPTLVWFSANWMALVSGAQMFSVCKAFWKSKLDLFTLMRLADTVSAFKFVCTPWIASVMLALLVLSWHTLNVFLLV